MKLFLIIAKNTDGSERIEAEFDTLDEANLYIMNHPTLDARIEDRSTLAEKLKDAIA